MNDTQITIRFDAELLDQLDKHITNVSAADPTRRLTRVAAIRNLVAAGLSATPPRTTPSGGKRSVRRILPDNVIAIVKTSLVPEIDDGDKELERHLDFALRRILCSEIQVVNAGEPLPHAGIGDVVVQFAEPNGSPVDANVEVRQFGDAGDRSVLVGEEDYVGAVVAMLTKRP
jgi:hypothetical protein